MKKLKQMSGPYCIGFELSSTAHGFVATDPNGNVLYHGKQPVMGTRVFKEGQHAAEARMPRTSRRGIQRRRGREHEMERVFAPVISPIDPDFFIRRRMSYKLGKIRFESDPIGFSYSRLFHSFPTLAHLDVALMEADSAMDPRLIFEAVANHVVRRGHFLLENQNVSSTNSDIDTQVANYAEVLVSYFEDTLDERIEPSLEALDINGNVTARELQKRFASAMCVSGDDIQKKTEKAQIKAIADLVAGYKADLTALVPDAEKLPKVSISDGDALEEFLADSCPDSLVPVLMAAQALYTSWKLQGMLSYAPGKSLSHNQVAQHEMYGKQLRMLKNLALKYVAKQDEDGNVDEDGFKDYVRFFGGPKCEDRYRYDKVQVKKQDSPKKNMGYTAYNLNVLGYEEFAKRVELLFKDTDGVNDPQYKTMMEAFANHAFLRRIHTVDNAAIPYQLHVEVVNRIIDNQGRFYPWLIDAREHILKVLTSRIPYYVGPLDSTDHGKAGENGTRFAWVKRLAGHEDAFVSPWNYEDHIDIDTTAELFIRRMTGECSYLDGEDVLAKNSLLYEKYCFFNELASLSFTEDGDSWMPFDAGMRKAIYDAASVAGKAPDRIYLKVTRTASNSRKGKRTAKRSDKIKQALKALDADAAADLGAAKLLRELGMFDEKEINERIYLYFHQAGKCLYTGKPIDITRIASNDYYVDHVVPLAYRKDESLDNKVLVYAEASRYKSETLLVSPAVQRKMLPFWRMLRNAGLMSERKLNALIRTEISEGMLKSIIGRQFTENSWEAKLFTAAIAAKYPGTVVIPVKAGVIGAVRSRIGIPKSLKANQFYHAHDALLAAEVGRYMELAKPAFVHNRVKYEQYIRKIKLVNEENKKTPKSQLDFFAGGFFFDRVDKDTGEVYWNKDEEVERIYRACGWKNLRVTYAAFEDGGAFWKQTIYSPREKSKLIATKSDRPAEIYGGYSSQTFANFFVYEVMKKKVKQLRFGAVPAAIASKSDPDTYNAMLEMYARGLAKTAKEKFVRIVRARVLKNTMIELYGERFRIAGEKQVYPVRQMPLAIDEMYLLKGVETIVAAGNAGASARIDFEKTAESLVGFWDLLLEKLPVNYPKLTVQLKLLRFAGDYPLDGCRPGS